MRKAFAAIIVLSLLSTAAAQAAGESAFDRVMRTGTLHCGFIPWPPGFDVDVVTGAAKGPAKELFESIIKLAGWKVQFVQMALGDNAQDLNNGKIDAVCADGPWTIARIKFVDYTTPAAYTPVMVYVRAGEKRFHGYSDLDNAKVTLVGIDGDISTDLALLRFPKAKLHTLSNLTDPSQMLIDVADGKEDAVILDPVTADHYMRNNPGKIRMLTPQALAVYPVEMSVRRGETQLQQTLDRATEMASNIGLIDKMLLNYDPLSRKYLYAPLKTYSVPGK